MPEGLLDRPRPYGIVLSISPSDIQEALVLSRRLDDDLSEARADGLIVTARFQPATKESAKDEQPIVTPSTILAYEGRVDNRLEIAYELGVPRLASESEGAVLVAAHEAWGAALSAKVIGEYAYVAFDLRSRRVVAGQDSLGVRRLFYCVLGERMFIASNLRLLFEVYPSIRPAYDRAVFAEYFTGTMFPRSGRTIWKGISELGRGNALVQNDSSLEQRRVWQPGDRQPERLDSVDAVDERFRAHVFEAVRVALRCQGPLLCDLSGGYDSSTIFMIAAHLIEAGESDARMTGWSYVSKRSKEAIFQEAVRQPFTLETHTLDWSDYLPFKAFTDTELPAAGFVQMGAIDRATRQFAALHGIRTHLTGQAADVLLQKGGGGAPVYLADWFRQGRFRDWSTHFLAYLRGGSFSAWQLLRYCTIGTLDLHVGVHAPIPDWLTPQFKREMKEAKQDFLRRRSRVLRSLARERIYRWTLCFIPYGNGGALPDERIPFAYRPLVEFILGLEWQHLMSPNQERLLMSRSLRRILPEIVRSGHCQTPAGAVLYEVRIPAHREHSFRFNVNTDSGHREHGFRPS